MILNTYVNGEGEPLILFHSFGNTGNSMHEEVMEFFVDKGYKVLRPDLRGHGESVGEIKNYFSYAADDVKDTLDSFGIEKCHIAGVSYGGVVALLFAQRYPEYIKSLSVSGVFPVKPEDWDKTETQDARWFEEFLSNSEMASVLNEMHGNRHWKKIFQAAIDDELLYPFEHTSNVLNISVPMICISGGSSQQEIANAVNFKNINPDIHIAVIPFAGHIVSEEQPLLYSHTLHEFICRVDNKK